MIKKQELIDTIALMHIIVQDWEELYGITSEQANQITKIGDKCIAQSNVNVNYKNDDE